MDVIIRKAVKEDCPRMMELIKELAIYEKAPDAVTVDFNHFVESGFGDKPIWWAFLAEVNGRVEGFALWYIRYSTWKSNIFYTHFFDQKFFKFLLLDSCRADHNHITYFRLFLPNTTKE